MKNNTSDYTEKNDTLHQLIKDVDNSAISAWKAGDILKMMKKDKIYREKYSTFEKYTKTELNLNANTANNYIEIREKFELDEISKITLIGHLKVIADIENVKLRKEVLRNIQEIEEENSKKAVENNEDPKPQISIKDIVATVAMIVNSGKNNYTKDEIQDLIKTNISKGKQTDDKQKDAKKRQQDTDKDKFGAAFKSEYFREISSLIENEPINEMGVVALFCVMFYSLRGNQFEWKNPKTQSTLILSFTAIKYVRAEFPDACIRCKINDKKKTNIELNIEFEYQSYNYIRHGHTKSKKECDMIICWEENCKTDEKLSSSSLVKNLPPILCLKNCFETGELELI